MLDDASNGQLDISNLEMSTLLRTVNNHLIEKMESLKKNRTACLWLQYMTLVQLVRNFLRSERLGNWNAHLACPHEMLPYLAASGHNDYTKSIHIYISSEWQM